LPNGDIHTFEEIVNQNGKAIFQYIFSLVGHKQLAEDIYQEVLLSAYLAYPTIKEQSKCKGWLYVIAKNKCRDYWRKEKKSKQFWMEEVHAYEAMIEPSTLPEEEILHKDIAQQMVEKVNELPRIYQYPIYLYYFQDCTLAEIAKKSNLPLSTVKTRIQRAKGRLRPMLQSFA
jgi:RNA polymerase sigma-70 factor (ECF subfamily)